MKKFHFSLRPVAILRAHQESKAREAFATAVRAYVAAEERLATARTRRAELESILFAGRRDRFNAAEAAAFFRAYRQECAAEMKIAHDVVTTRAEMIARRAASLEAHRRLQVVHRLEEKARAAHRRETARVEQAGIDELAAFRASRHQPVFVP